LWHRLGRDDSVWPHDIDEAVYLGQRVVVLSSSPTVVMETSRRSSGRRSQRKPVRWRFADLRKHLYAQVSLESRTSSHLANGQ
jgi:NitT/TauT family transport system ATP-binding protein